MNTKLKFLLFMLGGIVLLTGAVFLWRHYFQQEKSPAKENFEKSVTGNSFENKESGVFSEQKTGERKIQENSNGVSASNSDKDADELTSENNKKFDSNEDNDEETDDGITVEIETDDE